MSSKLPCYLLRLQVCSLGFYRKVAMLAKRSRVRLYIEYCLLPVSYTGDRLCFLPSGKERNRQRREKVRIPDGYLKGAVFIEPVALCDRRPTYQPQILH